jgi:hypothetical protein
MKQTLKYIVVSSFVGILTSQATNYIVNSAKKINRDREKDKPFAISSFSYGSSRTFRN